MGFHRQARGCSHVISDTQATAQSLVGVAAQGVEERGAYLLIGVLLAVHRPISSDQQSAPSVQVSGHSSSRVADGCYIVRAAYVPTAVIPPVPMLQGALYEGVVVDHGCRVVAFIVGV